MFSSVVVAELETKFRLYYLKRFHSKFENFWKLLEKFTRAAFLIAFYVCTRNFIQFGGKLTEKSLQQFWINHPLNCIFENSIANVSPSIFYRFGWNFIWRYRILRGRRLCYSFPNCFQNFPKIFLNWKIFKFFLQNYSRAAYLSRFSLSIRNFMRFGGKLRENSLQQHLHFSLRPRLSA